MNKPIIKYIQKLYDLTEDEAMSLIMSNSGHFRYWLMINHKKIATVFIVSLLVTEIIRTVKNENKK